MSEPEAARLIPVSGITGQREAEKRATSALLAVLSIVRPLSATLLAPLGCTRAKTARVEAFVEPSYDAGDKTLRPDGLIRVSVGNRATFEALVEVKTGLAKLDADQINAYLDLARTEGHDCVITISNEIAPSASSIGRCTVPVMMTGANTSTDRWRYQHARRTAGVARTRGDRCCVD